jgi:16S rRNA processing protein RimM
MKDMKTIKIGQIVNTVGLKGEVKIYSFAENLQRFENLKEIFVEDELFLIEKSRVQKTTVVLKLESINSSEIAEGYRNKFVYIPEEDLEELPEDSYYIKDLLGLEVFEKNGEKLGLVSDIIKGPGQDLYEIKGNGKTFLLPGVKEFVLDIDLAKKRITVDPPKGLLDL